jgi:hypothetical protein
MTDSDLSKTTFFMTEKVGPKITAESTHENDLPTCSSSLTETNDLQEKGPFTHTSPFTRVDASDEIVPDKTADLKTDIPALTEVPKTETIDPKRPHDFEETEPPH